MTSLRFAQLAVLVLAAAFASIAAPASAQTKTLRLVTDGDLKILDPTFTTAYVTRDFGYMVYDMPFGLDASGQPKPQMVDKYSTSRDGKLWTFTLRPGLKFSDGSAVTAADVAASMTRWGGRDAVGRAMTAMAGGEWKAIDASSFTLTLRQPFGHVLLGMAKPSGFPPVVMPERLAKQPTTQPLSEVMGSGPYVFKRDEWVPGNKVVFVRNPHYVPRTDAPSALAGAKKAWFDRVEWLTIPDGNTAVAALKNGEIDLIATLPPDRINALRGDAGVKLMPSGTWGGLMVMNQLHPPFDNPKIRQAVLKGVSQDQFMSAIGYPKDLRMTHCASFFTCGGRFETAAGAENWRTPDPAQARRLLAEAGYKGEKVVLLVPTDLAISKAEALVAAQTLESMGMNVDTQFSDWGSIVARRAKKDAPQAGGWNIYITNASSFDLDSPITNAYLSASCGTPLPGWPCDKPLDELRAAWLGEADPRKRAALLDQFHARAFEALPYINIGQFSPALAVRKGIKGAENMARGLPLVWHLHE